MADKYYDSPLTGEELDAAFQRIPQLAGLAENAAAAAETAETAAADAQTAAAASEQSAAQAAESARQAAESAGTVDLSSYLPREEAAETYAPVDAGVAVYTHTRTGAVHNLQGTGANGRVQLTADVQAGDTWTVNGTSVDAYMGADAATDAMAGETYTGRWLTFVYADGAVNFKGGGGVNPGKATAAPQQVLAPATFFAGGKALQTGTMPDLAGATVTGTVDTSGSYLRMQPQSAGYMDKASYIRAAFSAVRSAIGLTADKIVPGETVLGIQGTGSAVDLALIETHNTAPSAITVKQKYSMLILVCTQYNKAPGISQYYNVSVSTNAQLVKQFSVIGTGEYDGTFGAGTFVFVYKNVSSGTTFNLTYKYPYGNAIVIGG